MTEAFPLAWPPGWPRIDARKRQTSSPFKVNPGQALDELMHELELLGAKNVVISSNLTISTFGRPYANQPRQEDPGIAVYFTLNDRQMVMARDRFADWRDNIRSIGLAINALRALHRHGGAYMMERAFDGFAALPPPSKGWRKVLDLPDHTDLGAAHTAWREKCKAAGGATLDLNAAIEDARRELSRG